MPYGRSVAQGTISVRRGRIGRLRSPTTPFQRSSKLIRDIASPVARRFKGESFAPIVGQARDPARFIEGVQSTESDFADVHLELSPVPLPLDCESFRPGDSPAVTPLLV